MNFVHREKRENVNFVHREKRENVNFVNFVHREKREFRELREFSRAVIRENVHPEP